MKAGTILYWVTKAEGVSADQPMSLSKQIDCFYAAYACLVPVFTLIAFLRRAHALYAVAFAIYVTVFLGLFFQVDFLRYVLQTSYMLPSVGARNFAGIILILTGMVRPHYPTLPPLGTLIPHLAPHAPTVVLFSSEKTRGVLFGKRELTLPSHPSHP